MFNWNSYHKSGKICLKLGQLLLLQIGQNYYKSGKLLLIGAIITIPCTTFFFCLQGRSFLITSYVLYSVPNLENNHQT